MTLAVGIGDVLVVTTGGGWSSKLIRIGSILRGGLTATNHVAIVHHQTDGVWWCVEGRPGGVGWLDARRYLRDPHTVTNIAQPKTDAQRHAVAAEAETMLGRAYDWAAIMTDALESLGIHNLWTQDWDGQGVPGHVVCSSFAAYLYGKAGMAHPGVKHERYVFPSDWAEFCIGQKWKRS